jgi:hypothetical protein
LRTKVDCRPAGCRRLLRSATTRDPLYRKALTALLDDDPRRAATQKRLDELLGSSNETDPIGWRGRRADGRGDGRSGVAQGATQPQDPSGRFVSVSPARLAGVSRAGSARDGRRAKGKASVQIGISN